MIAFMPNLAFEIEQGRKAGKIVCGADEVGRGPLAGPVVAAAVVIPPEGLPSEIAARIRDSKKLSETQREALFPILSALCPHAIAESSVAEIDRLNILQASLLAMTRAIESLSGSLGAMDHALIDGNRLPKLSIPATPIVKGDDKSLSIAAASILAKVTRDRLMKRLATAYPGYGWEHNAGYPTAAHLDALAKQGITPHHRLSFGPVKKLLAS